MQPNKDRLLEVDNQEKSKDGELPMYISKNRRKIRRQVVHARSGIGNNFGISTYNDQSSQNADDDSFSRFQGTVQKPPYGHLSIPRPQNNPQRNFLQVGEDLSAQQYIQRANSAQNQNNSVKLSNTVTKIASGQQVTQLSGQETIEAVSQFKDTGILQFQLMLDSPSTKEQERKLTFNINNTFSRISMQERGSRLSSFNEHANTPGEEITEKEHPEVIKKMKRQAIDILSLLDDDCDGTLYFDELKEFWEALVTLAKNDSKKIKFCFITQNKVLKTNKYELMDLLRRAENQGFSVDKIQSFLYNKRAGFCGMCPCRTIRSIMMRQRFDRKTAEQVHYGWISVIKNFIQQVIHMLDFVTDFNLAIQMYIASRPPAEQLRWGQLQPVQNQGKQYHVAFIWIIMAILGPYIIQFSSMINAYFIKGIFSEDRWRSFSRFRRVQMYLSMTVFGLFQLFILDIIIKLQVAILFLTFPLHFTPLRRYYIKLRRWLESICNKAFLLTFYEVESFEKQKKHTQVLFEDFIMLTLNGFIFINILDVPIIQTDNLDKKPFIMQVSTTFLSVIFTYLTLRAESQGLNEGLVEFVMTSVKAKQDWVPHGEIISKGQLNWDIDFSRIEFKRGKLTDVLGIYEIFEYQFNEYSLQKLATQILAGVNKTRRLANLQKKSHLRQLQPDTEPKQVFKQRMKYGFSVYHVSAHMFLHFIDRIQSDHPEIVQEQFDFSEISWEQLIYNSIEQGHFQYKSSSWCNFKNKVPEQNHGKTLAGRGKYLLQICIDNEKSRNGKTEQFHLEKLFVLLLQQGWCDPNVMDFDRKMTLLTYAQVNKKYRSFELMLEHSNIDPNKKNANGTTVYGELFYQCLTQYYQDKYFKPREHIRLLHQQCQKEGRTKLDIHQQSIDILQKGVISTPIYSYFKRRYDQIELNGDIVVFNENDTSDIFGQDFDKFLFKNDCEHLEFIKLFFDSSKIKEKAKAFFKMKVTSKINNIFERAKDQDGNNLMHVTGATFSENGFHNFTTHESFNDLKPFLRKQMLEKNNFNKTPMEELLALDAPLKRIERLIEFELLDVGSFRCCEDQLIDFITRKVIRNQSDKKLKEKLVFGTRENNKRYFQLFDNELDAYLKQKESFQKRGFSDMFEQLFTFQNNKIKQQSDNQLQIKVSDNDYESDLTRIEQQEFHHESKLIWQTNQKLIKVTQKPEVFEPITEESVKQIYLPQLTLDDHLLETSQPTLSQSFLDQYLSNTLDYQYMASSNISHDESPGLGSFSWLESCLVVCIDISSIADLISDLIILVALYENMHTSWFSITIMTILSPYYAVYTSLMNFQIEVNRKIRRTTKGPGRYLQQVMQLVFIFPTMLVFLILFDLIYSLVNSIILPIIIFSSLKTNDTNGVKRFERKLDDLMYFVTGMNYMDIKGFRSQRTILQLQLESFPQILFQGYMLMRLHQMNSDSNIDKIGVSMEAIVFSLIMALIHMVLESLNLYIEAKTWNNGLRDYMIACHNAKQGWIAQSTSFDASVETDSVQLVQKKEITFDDKSEKFCGFKFSVGIIFTDLSIEPLISIVSNLPKVQDKSLRQTLNLGQCIRELSVEKFIQLLTLSHQKVNLFFQDHMVNVLSIFENDYKFMESLRKPQGPTQKGDPLIIDMVQKDYYQIVEVLIHLGAKFDLKNKNQEGLFKIALVKKYSDTLQVLMKLLDVHYEYFRDSILEGEMFYQEIFLRLEQHKEPLLPVLFMQPQFLVPFEMQNSFIYSLPTFIKQKGERVARNQFDYLWGCHMPVVTFEMGDDMEPCIPKIEQWLNRYPSHFTIQIEDKIASFNSKFLCSFVAFRRELYQLKKEKQVDDYIATYVRGQVIKLGDPGFSMEDLICVYNIFSGDAKSISPQQINLAQTDNVVTKFGLDKMRDFYFYESRLQVGSRNGLVRQERETVMITEKWTEYSYKVHQDMIAMKSFELTLSSTSGEVILSKPLSLQLYVEYNVGHQKAKLTPPLKLFVDSKSVESTSTLSTTSSKSILRISTPSTSNVEDSSFEKLSQTLMMNIEGGNTLTFHFRLDESQRASLSDRNDNQLVFGLNFEFYLKFNK